jgi:hypothetical protein
MSCCKTYDPCLDGKLNSIGSYSSAARQYAESAKASEEKVQADFVNISALTQAFNQKYLGAFPVAPTEPPTIPEGALYWNTASDFFYVWDGAAWVPILLGLIPNAQVDAAAAIAHSKLANIPAGQVLLGNASNVPTATAISGDVTVNSSGVTEISAGAIVNADVNGAAAIAYSKLALANSIVNADINAAAAIAASKLAVGTARQLLQTNAGATSAEWSSNIDIPGTLDVTGAAVLDSSLTVSGNALINGTGALGYATGSGGTVTQITSRTTGVTIDKTNGAIELFSAAGSGTYQTFTVTNSTVADTDVVIVSQKSGTDPYKIFVTNVSAGSFDITFATASGTTTEQPVFNFAVIKAATA